MDRELLVADREADDGELGGGGAAGEDVALLRGIVFAAWDGVVDGLAGAVVDEAEGGSRVGDGGVVGTLNGFAGDDGGGAVEHPEALGIVYGCVGRCLAGKGFGVDVAEGVEGGAFVGIGGVLVGAQVGGEEFRGLGDVALGDHVLDGCLHGGRGDGVDGAPGETEEAVAAVLLELGGERFGKLDGLVFDLQAADCDVVCSHCARGGRVVPIGDFPA